MAIRQKKGEGLVRLKDTVSSSDGTTVTITETWTGPYKELQVKQNSVILKVKGTSLVPTQAGHGTLTITREEDVPTGSTSSTVPGQDSLETIWQELRKPVETNPFFAEMPTQDILDVKKAVENGEPVPTEGEEALKLWTLLSEGTTEWSTGVPVVRRTRTQRRKPTEGARAWTRDDPPIDVDGDWEFLKTADETRKEGRSYTRVEEWTGAESWDEDLYPTAGEDP